MTVYARSSSLIGRIRQHGREFEASRPGRRFVERYERRQRSGCNTHKALKIAIGGLVFLLGIVLLGMPGPGILVMMIGAGLVAEQSYVAARALDKAEVRARRRGTAMLRYWQRTSLAAKVVMIAAGTAAGVMLVGYVLVFVAS